MTRCNRCFDTGFVHRRHPRTGALCTTPTYCTCRAGKQMEADDYQRSAPPVRGARAA